MSLHVYSVYKPLMGMNCTELGGDISAIEGKEVTVRDADGTQYEFIKMWSPSVGDYWSWQGGPIPLQSKMVEVVK